MPRRWTRRRRRIVRTVAISGSSLALIVAAIVLLKPSPEPYLPGERMEGLTETLARTLPQDHPGVNLVDVASQAGIDFVHFQGARSTQLPEDMGSGAAWGDYDNDGWIDLYVVNFGPMAAAAGASVGPSNVLYRNRGDGTFEDVTETAGVANRAYGLAAAWGDHDNDGLLDLFVTNFGTNVFYRNLGDGTFEDISQAAGVSGVEGFWAGVSWGDYNRDGNLDIYVCGYVRYISDPESAHKKTQQYETPIPASLNPSTYKPHHNLLYRNNGDGTFTDVAVAAGVDNVAGRSLSATWCDFDSDGWIDLYLANDISDNMLFHNRGDGTFADVSHAAWVADYRGAMGLAVGDWDEDQDLDLFVTHWIAQENALYNNMHADFAGAGVNDGVPHFTDVADQFGLGQIALDYIGWGTTLTDMDCDGLLDILVVNGSTFQQDDDPRLLIPMRTLFFWNRGPQDGFFEIGSVCGDALTRKYVGRGLAMGDYDNDGDADAFVTVNGGRPLLLNNERANGNHWLKVRLRGQKANRFGVGARLRVVAGGHTAIRESGAGSSYLSQHAVGEELFGLGEVTRVDSLVVVWPSGVTRKLVDFPADQTVVITDSTGE